MSERSRGAILVIDNDETYARALQVRFEAAGYACTTAYTGAQGILAFGATDFDLVVTDLNMPGGDGVLVAERIRTLSPVPIIVATGFHDAYEPRLRGMPDLQIIRKPFSTEDLVTLVGASLVASEAG